MNRPQRSCSLLLALLLPLGLVTGCGGGPEGVVRGDGGGDTSAPDGALDSSQPDSGAPDSSTTDSGAPLPDASTPDGGVAACTAWPACDAPAPAPTATGWDSSIASSIIAATGGPGHRGRDLVLTADAEQWAMAKFAYGTVDKDLKGETVEIWLLRDCGESWEMLGTAVTTNDGDHGTVDRVEDTGGRVYFRIPEAQRLGPGRHRVHFIVRGDSTFADQYIQVLAGGERFVVSDVDGTLTESETAQVTALFTGSSPEAQPSSAEMLQAFHDRGFVVFYITARPDWLQRQTHRWLRERGYPPGLVRTSFIAIGAQGAEAIAYKTLELTEIGDRLGYAPEYAFGNTATDAQAFLDGGVGAEGRMFYQFADDVLGGRHFEDYADMIPEVEALGPVCR